MGERLSEAQRAIEAFVSVRKRSTGGYAPVDPSEIDELHEIVRLIVQDKYERDPDGDLPIRTFLVDRTRYVGHLVYHKHTHRIPDEEAIVELARAAGHASSIAEQTASLLATIAIQSAAGRLALNDQAKGDEE